MNFSTGGDNIKTIIINNDCLDIPKALSKNESIDNYITDRLTYLLKNPEQFCQEALLEVYFVKKDNIYLKVNEKLRVVFNKDVPYLGMKKVDCE